jgi:hypothetical protein
MPASDRTTVGVVGKRNPARMGPDPKVLLTLARQPCHTHLRIPPTEPMSLSQRILARASSSTLSGRLVQAMETVPHAAGLALAYVPGGIRGVLVIDAADASFVAAERRAAERLPQLRRSFPDLTIDLICVPTAEADAIQTPPDMQMQIYRYERGR